MAILLTDEDLDAAVAEGVVTPQVVSDLRAYVERRRAAPAADEEQFRLLTGFNDIFVSIAIAMVLIALGWLGSQFASSLGPALVAVASWALAEFFTARRRMALPSILLLLAWVGGVCAGTLAFLAGPSSGGPTAPHLVLAGLTSGAAAYAHWRRFKVPITVAAGAGVVIGLLLVLVATWIPAGRTFILPLVFVSGLSVFALALWWDMSDPQRKTRRADVAFWLHLAAAPLLVHPVFSLLGFDVTPWRAMIAPDPTAVADFARPAMAVAVYLALAIVALMIDRRALMVSALVYLLYAMNTFFRATGALSVSFAISALVAGAALLLLSAYWRPARQLALTLAPAGLRTRLPAA